MPAALELLNDFAQSGVSVAQWVDYKWNMEWQENTSRLHSFIADISTVPSKMFFFRLAWVGLYRLRAGVGLFFSAMHKRSMARSVACECGTKEQTAEYVITFFPIYYHPTGADALSAVDLADRQMSGHLVDYPLNFFPKRRRRRR